MVYARALQAEPDSLASRLAVSPHIAGIGTLRRGLGGRQRGAGRNAHIDDARVGADPLLNGLVRSPPTAVIFRRAAEQFRAALALGSRTAPDSPDRNAHANYG